MDAENLKLDVTLPPEAFRLIRFMANLKRISTDEMAARLLVYQLRSFAEEANATTGSDIEKVMERAWGK